jgi:flagellar FliJ protein
MAKFIFKLRGVLRQREHVEQEKMRALAVCLKQEADCRAEINRLNESVQVSNDDMRANHLVGVLDMSFITAHRRFMLAMHRQALSLAQKLATAQQRVTEARLALAEAAKQKKVLEKLRDKQHERWRSEIAAKEARDLDEIGMQLAYQASVEEAGEL